MSNSPFSSYKPWLGQVSSNSLHPIDPQDDSYLESSEQINPFLEAEIVTNRVIAIAQLIEAITMNDGAEGDVARLRKLAMDLLIDPEPEIKTPEESPHEVDNADIE